MAKTFWTLSLSQKPGENDATVTINSSEDVPVRGEKKQIVGLFRTKTKADVVRKKMGDNFLLSHWGCFLFVEHRGGKSFLVGEGRMNEIIADFLRKE